MVATSIIIIYYDITITITKGKGSFSTLKSADFFQTQGYPTRSLDAATVSSRHI